MKFIRLIALSLILFSNLGLFAQQSIESAMKSLENSKSVTNEVYNERRNPVTKAVVSSNRLYEFSDDKLANKLIDAIRKERGNAASFQMNSRNPKAAYNITFEKKDGSAYSKYTLVQQGDGMWVFSVIKSTAKTSSSKKKGKSKDHSLYYKVPGVQSTYGIYHKGYNLAVCDEKGIPFEWACIGAGTIHDSNGNAIVIEKCDKDMVHSSARSYSCVTVVNDNEAAAYAREQAAYAREQAAYARQQAAYAREQAAYAREQAVEAQKKAVKAQKKAAEAKKKAMKRSHSKTVTSVSGGNYYVSYN